MKLRSHVLLLASAPCLLVSTRVLGQAAPTATGSGGYIAIGAAVSGYHFPYGQQDLAGFTVFADGNLTRRLGVEGEFRRMNLHTSEETRFDNYLIGPKYSFAHGRYLPYAKVLLGRGDFTYPFAYAKGSYFAVAPGAGLDVRIFGARAFFRVLDFEYQSWPNSTFGATHPYGLSSGLSIRLY